MLEHVRKLFAEADVAEKKAELNLAALLHRGREITFCKGNMRENANAEVICTSGRRIKVKVVFSKAERWIDFADVQGI